jgi:sporulation protein YlmC with PRC-barrel domain
MIQMNKGAGAASAQTPIVGSAKSKMSGPGPEVMASGTLEGNDVVNPGGDKLGDIKEIMLDVPHGRIAYAVLSRGGVLGMGDKLFAIPWSALTLDTDRKCFVLDISEESLKNAEGFDKDNWPRMADETWARGIYQYYNQPPYW